MTHKVVVMSVSVRDECECLFDSNAPNLARRKISVNRREQITLKLGRCLSFLCYLRCIYLLLLTYTGCENDCVSFKVTSDRGGRRVTPLTHEVSACHVRRQRWIWLADKCNQCSVCVCACVCARLHFWIRSLNLGHTRTIWKAVESFPSVSCCLFLLHHWCEELVLCYCCLPPSFPIPESSSTWLSTQLQRTHPSTPPLRCVYIFLSGCVGGWRGCIFFFFFSVHPYCPCVYIGSSVCVISYFSPRMHACRCKYDCVPFVMSVWSLWECVCALVSVRVRECSPRVAQQRRGSGRPVWST